MDYTTNAPQGAAFLTEKMPGWEYRVDLSRLNMTSARDCVLAQVYRTWYFTALDMLLFPDGTSTDVPVFEPFPRVYEEALRLGFEMPTQVGWKLLGQEWAQIITELRNK